MHHRLKHFVALVFIAGLAASLLVSAPAQADPSADPVWSGLDARNYSGPIGAPGTLIAKTPLDPSLKVAGSGPAYRFHYATRDVHNKPTTSTGAIFLPKTPAPEGGYPVIAWAHGTVGLADDCTPSARPRSDRDDAYLTHWLNQGYAVVATDYAGLGTPGVMNYLSSEAQARNIVHSVMAAQHADLPLAKKWAIVGQSQGAGAAMNAANRATALSRGTGLDYRGVVATGTPANIEHIVWQAGPLVPPITLPAGLNAYAAYILAGFTDARPDLRVGSVLTSEGERVLGLARSYCLGDMSEAMQGARINEWFTRPLASIPNIQAALVDYMAVPYTGYDRPIFLGQGLLDMDVPAPSALSLYAQLVANGQPVELHVYPNQDHSGTVLASLPDSTPFVRRILA